MYPYRNGLNEFKCRKGVFVLSCLLKAKLGIRLPFFTITNPESRWTAHTTGFLPDQIATWYDLPSRNKHSRRLGWQSKATCIALCIYAWNGLQSLHRGVF